jgi:hypothetical protein
MTMTIYFSVLAMSMLPDGAETQLDDWTIFFLNQTPFNTISPVLALDTPEVRAVSLPGDHDDTAGGVKPDLLCVLNLVRTKHDKTLDRHVLSYLHPMSAAHGNLSSIEVPKSSPLRFVRGTRSSRSLRWP